MLCSWLLTMAELRSKPSASQILIDCFSSWNLCVDPQEIFPSDLGVNWKPLGQSPPGSAIPPVGIPSSQGKKRKEKKSRIRLISPREREADTCERKFLNLFRCEFSDLDFIFLSVFPRDQYAPPPNASAGTPHLNADHKLQPVQGPVLATLFGPKTAYYDPKHSIPSLPSGPGSSLQLFFTC